MGNYDPFMFQDRILREQVRAYRQLVMGSETLLRQGGLGWTEQIFLTIVRGLYRKRVEQAAEIFPSEWFAYEDGEEELLKELVEATLGGHDLGSWEKTEEGYMVTCKLCQEMTWIGDNGIRYSLLADMCPNREKD